MKLSIKVLIVILSIIPLLPIQADPYRPLTDREAEDYWNSISRYERIEEIRKLDLIEHASPVISGVQFGALLDKKGNLLIWPLNPIKIEIAYLEYNVILTNIEIKNFEDNQNPDKFFSYILTPAITTGLALTSTAIGGGDGIAKYIITGIIGLATGVVMDIFIIK